MQTLPGVSSNGRIPLASATLVAATVLLPAGFFAGGVSFYSGDPGVGIAVVPIGATCLAIAVCLMARAVSAASDSPGTGRKG